MSFLISLIPKVRTRGFTYPRARRITFGVPSEVHARAGRKPNQPPRRRPSRPLPAPPPVHLSPAPPRSSSPSLALPRSARSGRLQFDRFRVGSCQLPPRTAYKAIITTATMEVASAPSPHGGAKGWSSLAGLLTGAGAGVEDLERWREEVLETLARIDAKRDRLQGQIGAASRGSRRRAPRRAAPGTAAARVGGHAPPPLPPPAAASPS